MKFINDKTHSYLSKLFVHELRNAYIYQVISSYLMTKGLTNFSLFFKERSREEFKHAEWVREFCEEKNILLNFGADIEGFEFTLPNMPISYFCQLAYNTEIETNELWSIFYDMVYQDGNSRLFISLANKFMLEQNEETAWASDLMDYAENLKDNVADWQKFDKNWDYSEYSSNYSDDDD